MKRILKEPLLHFHLLFVLALLTITGGGWKLVKTVTAFTVSHSLTLTAATLGWVHIPPPPVEAVIALSIVLVAAEIVRQRRGIEGFTARVPWFYAQAGAYSRYIYRCGTDPTTQAPVGCTKVGQSSSWLGLLKYDFTPSLQASRSLPEACKDTLQSPS